MKKMAMVMAMGFISAMAAGVVVAGEHPADFSVHNKTGFAIVSLFVSPADNEHWGEDIQFSGDASVCKWDIKLEEKGGKGWVVEDVNLCEVSHMQFSKKGDKVVYTKE
jgi:hypothetical protein